VIRRKTNRRHMTGDHHGQTPRRQLRRSQPRTRFSARTGAWPRPGPRTAGLTRPSGAAVSGPVLSALHRREEDLPACRPGRRARDAPAARAPGGRPATGQDRPGEGASSCRAQVPCTSSAPSRRRPRAAAPGGRPGMPLLTGPALRAVRAAACSRACGGCWPRGPAATAALTAEPAGTAPSPARRRSRTEHPPAGHPASRRRRQRADPRGAGHAGDATPQAAAAGGLRPRLTVRPWVPDRRIGADRCLFGGVGKYAQSALFWRGMRGRAGD
jgi:hypothetical protein